MIKEYVERDRADGEFYHRAFAMQWDGENMEEVMDYVSHPGIVDFVGVGENKDLIFTNGPEKLRIKKGVYLFTSTMNSLMLYAEEKEFVKYWEEAIDD